MSYVIGHPFGQQGPAVLPVFPPNFLCNPSLLASKAALEAEKALMLFKQCSAIAKTSVFYEYCFQHKSRTQTHANCYERIKLYHTQNQHKVQLHCASLLFLVKTAFHMY